MDLIFSFIFHLLIIVPVWIIFKRVGLHPALSLLLFVPFIGGLIVLIILAYARWPKLKAFI